MADTTLIGPFSQTLFLGASVEKFSSSIGWNGGEGSLQVDLAEDPCRNSKVYYDSCGNPQITTEPDFFNPPTMGSPVYFRFGAFAYTGILQGWEQTKGATEGKHYSVTLGDPVEILEGCQVITNDYTGSTFGVPNLINAFGFQESLSVSCNYSQLSSLNPSLGYTPAPGFGTANVSQDGMSWYQIKEAIESLNITPTVYGGNIQLREHRYFLDLSELPLLDANFRFQGDSSSIIDLISQVTKTVGMDFFLEILFFVPPWVSCGFGGTAGHIHPEAYKFIKVRTSNRYSQPTSAYNIDVTVGSPIDNRLDLGRITSFTGNGDGKARISRGLELRNDITNSFLVGDNRQDLWQQPYTGSANTYTDTIWQYWGKDSFGFPIISNGTNNDHAFSISTTGFDNAMRSVIGSTYTINVLEMRAALDSIETWSAYIEAYKKALATALKIDAVFIKDTLVALGGKPGGKIIAVKDLIDTSKVKAGFAAAHATDMELGEIKRRLFEVVRSYAENMGKKFLVSLPILCAAQDSSTPYAVKLNWQTSDGAWTDGNVQLNPIATSLSQASPILENLRLDDGRIQPFVYFNSIGASGTVDYSLLSPESVIPVNPWECYVKANVEELTFLNPVAMTYPRAIISIDNPVTVFASGIEPDAPIINKLWAVLAPDPTKVKTWMKDNVGNDTTLLGLAPLPISPIGAAIPLRSTTLSYGPWYTSLSFGPAAKTEYERNTSFSPWSFGSTQLMNYAAQVSVETKVTSQIVSEAGSITFGGAPSTRLGNILAAGGPEITNIDVSVGVDGVTTQYRMRTYVPNFGELGQRRIKNLQNYGLYAQKIQRSFIKNRSTPGVGGAAGNFVRELTRSDRFNRNSSHNILAGNYLQDYDNTAFTRTNVVMTDMRKSLSEITSNYGTKALMDLNGLLRPFATNSVNSSGIPSFSGYVGTTSRITAQSLNPFKISETVYGSSSGHDIEIVTRGNVFPTGDLSIKKGNNDYGDSNTSYRALGLRAPLVLVGWGFDLSGKPVPNISPTSPSGQFLPNYLRRPDTWKAGPLDVRWDDNRGVWSAVGASLRIARLKENLLAGNAASATLQTLSPSGVGTNGYILSASDDITVYDILTPSAYGAAIAPSGSYLYVQNEMTSNLYLVTGVGGW